MAKYFQDGRHLTVRTLLSGYDVKTSPLLLVGFSGHEGISQPFSFQLDLIAENQEEKKVVFDKLLGKKIIVEMELAGGKKRYFNGICNRVSQTGRDPVFTSFRMELVPEFWLLTRKAQSRIFQRMTVKDILAKVLEGIDARLDGIKEKDGCTDKNGTLGHPRDYCVQYRETDFNFACRLMEEEGIYYYFKHTEKGHEMILANTVAHPELEQNEEQKVPFGAGREMCVYAWTKAQSLRAGQYTLRDHCFELTSGNKPPFFQDLQAEQTIAPSVKVGEVDHCLQPALMAKGLNRTDQLETYDYPGEYAQRFDGVSHEGNDQSDELNKIFCDNTRTAKIRMQEEAATSVQIQGASDCRHFAAGHKFTLDKHFNANGPYVLTDVMHSVSLQGYRSGESAGLSYQNSFTCIPAALPFRPPRVTPKPVVLGTQTAVVVGKPGDEISVDKYGRVKVKFHWDRDAKDDLTCSCWARVAQPWAGKGWGVHFWPRVGHEVVVAFLEGDPDQPLIVGSVYNAENMPPYTLPQLMTRSGVKTHSTPKGDEKNFNEIRFEDKKGAEELYVHAERNLTTVVEASESRNVGGDVRVIIGGSRVTDIKRDMGMRVFGEDAGMQTEIHKGDYKLAVKKAVFIEADDGIALRCGGAIIGIDAEGNIYLQGTTVQINPPVVPPDLLAPIIPLFADPDPDAPEPSIASEQFKPAPSPNPLPPPPPPPLRK